MTLCIVLLCLTSLVLHPSHAQNSQQDYLNAHNVARKQVGVPNITWDSTVEAYAQNYANSSAADCNLVHSNGNYGENLAKGSGSFTGTAAVNLLGCARVQCSNGWWFVTCNYDPPGNYVGQRPY
ncbi:unnamed protein product [Prunus armeniaca]